MAAPPPYRDLLGHLCAEIERQQAQIGEQAAEIDELVQENDRLRAELEELSPSPLTSWADTAMLERPPPLPRAGCQSAGTQTCCVGDVIGDDDHMQGLARAKLTTNCCGCSCTCSTGAVQQPETAPEPPQLGGAGAAVRERPAPRAGEAEARDEEMDVLRGALSEATGNGTAPLEPSMESEGPAWTLSPTSMDSSASSQFWLALCSGSLPSSPSGDAASAAAIDEALSKAVGVQGLLRRQPSSSTWPSHRAAAVTATAAIGSVASAGGGCRRSEGHAASAASAVAAAAATFESAVEAAGLAAAGDAEPRRLVRSILDALDVSQKRLQQASRRRRRAGSAGNGCGPQQAGCAQVDIRIFYPGCSAATLEMQLGEQPELAGPGASKEATAAGDHSSGSFMYILL
mmetsp:Transcript_52529/g.170653  ORF Transcript_52529/g.170653 Transcript_52529/m.170653 type:complete len:402 (-) Transcript_52529:57-1262(-)